MKHNLPTKKTLVIKNIDDIRSLYKDLKNSRVVRNWGEFAYKIKYDRTYVSRVLNGHENLTDEFRTAIINTFGNETKNVTNETNENTQRIWLNIPEDEFQKEVLTELRQIKATVSILKVTVAKLAASKAGSDIAEELVRLETLIDAEGDRLLEKDKKKYG